MKEKSFIMLLYFWLQTEKPNVRIWQFFLLLAFGNGNTHKSFQFLIFNYVSLGEILVVKTLVMFDGYPLSNGVMRSLMYVGMGIPI